jgi:hypothetical protein
MPTSDAAQHFVIRCKVNIGLWVGMAEQRNCFANKEFTGHSPTSSRLEQEPYRRRDGTMKTQTCLGDPREA